MRFAFFLVLLLGLSTRQSPAQAPTNGGTAPVDPNAPTAVPLDGGAGLLLASGVAYGLRRLRQRRSN